jgi:hypothetical protein
MIKVSILVLFATLLVAVYSWPNSPGFTPPVEDGRNGNCNCPGDNSKVYPYKPVDEYQPNNGYNPNNGYRPTNGFNPNSAFNRNQPG